MSYTKYVMRDDDTFALISKMTGVEHSSLATLLGSPTRITSAGFLVLNDDGTIQTYGKSYSMGLDSSEEDGPVILAAINRGEVFIIENAEACIFYATNHSALHTADAVKATTSDLQHYRIIDRD